MDETMLFQRCQAGKNLIKHDPRFKMAEVLRKILGQHMDFPTLLPVKVEAGDN